MGIKRRTKNGKTYYVVTHGLYHTTAGKPRYRERWFTERREAERFERSRTGQPLAAVEKATILDLAEVWMNTHVANLAKRTRLDYQTQLDRRILPQLGSVRVERLQPVQVSAWLQDVGQKNQRSANKALGVLKAMLRWGRAHGYTTTRAADDVKRLKQPAPKGANPRTPEEVEQIANRMPTLRDRTVVILAAYSGLRFSELRALRWQDIDMTAGLIELQHSLDVDRSLKPTKSDNTRTVPILEPGMIALQEWHAATGNKASGHVFITKNNDPLGKDWYKTIREATGDSVSLHELRDTYASILIAAGVAEMELTLWLGHTSVEVTRRHYARLYARHRTTGVQKANELLRGE